MSIPSHGIASAHGGSLELVTSEPGAGTTFRVTLAASDQDEAALP